MTGDHEYQPSHARAPEEAAPVDHVERILEQWRGARPDLDSSPAGVIGRIHRLGDLLRPALVEVYREHGLGEGEFDVLATLRRQGPPHALQPRALAEQTMVTSGGMTKRLDRLEAAGLVSREPSAVDGRARLVALTAEGKRRIDAAYADHMANEARLLEGLGEVDRAAIARILGAWLARIESAA